MTSSSQIILKTLMRLLRSFFFDKADAEEQQPCKHTEVEEWAGGRGCCVTCGEIFTDASDVNSTITNCKHESVHKDESGMLVCGMCGTELETLDFKQE